MGIAATPYWGSDCAPWGAVVGARPVEHRRNAKLIRDNVVAAVDGGDARKPEALVLTAAAPHWAGRHGVQRNWLHVERLAGPLSVRSDRSVWAEVLETKAVLASAVPWLTVEKADWVGMAMGTVVYLTDRANSKRRGHHSRAGSAAAPRTEAMSDALQMTTAIIGSTIGDRIRELGGTELDVRNLSNAAAFAVFVSSAEVLQ